MGIVGGGAYAEYVTAHEDETIAIPSHMSFDDAAAIPEAFITAHDALFTQSSLQRGETVLIHAVGSGVGTAAVQLCRHAAARAFEAFALPLLESGALVAVVDRVFEMEEASAAHAWMESNRNFGKVLLRM
jgi:NADPH:quinone reductase-like Zn-dependent oxidoreductase